MKITKNELREKIEKRQPYIYNSSVAVIYEDKYLVYSYTTLICVYSLSDNKVTYFDNKHYSKTTSFLQSIIKYELF